MIILTAKAPIDKIERKKEANIKWQFYQKHILAICRGGTIFLNFPLLEHIVIIAAKNPIAKAIAIINVQIDLD